jgi:hypothetical protein
MGGTEQESESGSAGKRTIGTIKAGERLAEAIELAEAEKAKLAHYRAELLEAEKVISPEEHAKRYRTPQLPPHQASFRSSPITFPISHFPFPISHPLSFVVAGRRVASP